MLFSRLDTERHPTVHIWLVILPRLADLAHFVDLSLPVAIPVQRDIARCDLQTVNTSHLQSSLAILEQHASQS